MCYLYIDRLKVLKRIGSGWVALLFISNKGCLNRRVGELRIIYSGCKLFCKLEKINYIGRN